MKKIILLLLIATVSLTAFSAGLEVRGGMDLSGTQTVGGDFDDTDNDLASGGYVLRAEYLFGEGLEFGAGLAYKKYASLEEDDNDNTSTDTMIVYGTGKLNLGEAGMNPYLRLSAGASSFSGDYIDALDTDTQDAEVGMGLYYGAGLGIEVNNFLFEAVYEVQAVTVELSNAFFSLDAALIYTTTSLELGYKFGAGNYNDNPK